jgi:antibiotic biosynthesis monooxygenase (ABM) superfamily enzyme
MEVCVSRASAVFVQHVPAAVTDWFVEWQRDVTATAQHFHGYQDTDVFAPSADRPEEWVSVIHFEDDETLKHWMDSPERAEWVTKLRAKVGEFQVQTLHGGFGAWFTGLNRAADVIPPWKMALTVLFGLYPTVMLLTIFVGPLTSPLGFSVSMLIGNALSVALLQWLVVPMLSVPLGPWLKAKPGVNAALTAGTFAMVIALLAAMAALFRPITG